MRFRITLLVFCIASFSCEEQFGINHNGPPQQIIDISLELFDGDITENLSVKEDNANVWKIRIENDKGSALSFYWQKNYNILFKIIGDRGPFDYDLQPPLNVLPLSTARFLAFESFSSEALSSWMLKRQTENTRWIYQFFLRDNDLPYTIDATSGDVLRFYNGSM